MSHYDITFIGHMCYDEITAYQGTPHVAPGSAVLCGAMAAAGAGAKVAIVAKMATADEGILSPMTDRGVKAFVIAAKETTYSRVIHESPDPDVRRLILAKSAGFINPAEVPQLDSTFVHLAGISNEEFSMELMAGLKARGYSLSTDMQSFVRQVDPVTREIAFADVPAKRQIAALMDRLKLDVIEAKILTGTDNLEQAALAVESWGCPEVLITRQDGVLVRAAGVTHFEKFSNASIVGRTGRGDTTFAAYMAWRLKHGPAESTRFAAALVSIKMEKKGPFTGTLDEVLERMARSHGAKQ